MVKWSVLSEFISSLLPFFFYSFLIIKLKYTSSCATINMIIRKILIITKIIPYRNFHIFLEYFSKHLWCKSVLKEAFVVLNVLKNLFLMITYIGLFIRLLEILFSFIALFTSMKRAPFSFLSVAGFNDRALRMFF